MTRARWLTVLCATAIAAGVVVYMVRRGPERTAVDVGRVGRVVRFTSTVTASGEIVATRFADVGASAMGKIVRLPVAEGDRVTAGQLVARIDPVQAESEASGATAQLRALEAEERAGAEQVRAATAELAAAEARARDATQQATRRATLAGQGLIAAADLESARAAADASAAQVVAARAAADRARQAAEAAGRRVAQARAQLSRASDALAKTAIVSPIDGIVSRLRVREGEMVVVGIQNQPGTTLMTVSDLTSLNAEVKVAEADVLRLAVGQTALVTLEALPGRRFPGRVVEIGVSALPVTGTGAAAREFRVVVRLDSPDASLRPGMTADAEIITQERQNALTVPLQSVVLRDDGEGDEERAGVFVVTAGQARFHPVTVGVIGGLSIEVTGVDEGTPVVVGPYQVLRELQEGQAVETNAAPESR